MFDDRSPEELSSVTDVLDSIRQAVESEGALMSGGPPKKDFLSTLAHKHVDHVDSHGEEHEEVLELVNAIEIPENPEPVAPGDVINPSAKLADQDLLASLQLSEIQGKSHEGAHVHSWDHLLPQATSDTMMFGVGVKPPKSNNLSSDENFLDARSSAAEWDGQLLSSEAAASVASALAALKHPHGVEQGVTGVRSPVEDALSRALGDLVKEALKPLLKTWLDQNLPAIVQNLVAQEIKRFH